MNIVFSLLFVIINIAKAFRNGGLKNQNQLQSVQKLEYLKLSDKTNQLRLIANDQIFVEANPRKFKRLRLLPSDVVDNAMSAISYAFIGGTVGVMSVAVIVELQKVSDKGILEGCPYCMGNGEILCVSCFGLCSKMVNGVSCPCEACGGRGLVMCINCKGDGRETPIIFKSKATRDPEYSADSIAIDSP